MIKLFRAISIILTLIIMVSIFSLSNQNAELSSQTSGGLIENVLSAIYPNFNELDNEKREEVVSSFQFIVRKTAHFFIYFVLGVSVLMSVITYFDLKLLIRMIIGSSICIIYAAIDEIHQYFIAGRSCEFRDFLIDTSGSIIGILFGYLVFCIVSNFITKMRRKKQCLRKN